MDTKVQLERDALYFIPFEENLANILRTNLPDTDKIIHCIIRCWNGNK